MVHKASPNTHRNARWLGLPASIINKNFHKNGCYKFKIFIFQMQKVVNLKSNIKHIEKIKLKSNIYFQNKCLLSKEYLNQIRDVMKSDLAKQLNMEYSAKFYDECQHFL